MTLNAGLISMPNKGKQSDLRHIFIFDHTHNYSVFVLNFIFSYRLDSSAEEQIECLEILDSVAVKDIHSVSTLPTADTLS